MHKKKKYKNNTYIPLQFVAGWVKINTDRALKPDAERHSYKMMSRELTPFFY